MIRKAISLLIVLVVGLLAYNYFMGTDAEKEQVNEITKELKDVGIQVKDLLKSEKEKFDGGKYDDAIGKMGNILSGLGKKAQELGDKFPEKLKNLETQKTDLEQKLRTIKGDSPEDDQKKEEVNKDIEGLLNDIDRLTEEMDKAEK